MPKQQVAAPVPLLTAPDLSPASRLLWLALRLQQARDLIKEALCARQGIKLVTVRPQELTLAAMRAKVEPLLPLRDLTGQADLVRCLERESRRYRKKAYAT